VRIYFAGPLFSAAEQAWNAELVAALRAAGHEVFLPQDQERAKPAAGIFATDVRLDLPLASMAEVTGAVLDALDSLEVRR
jgi:nucleoside 2-deoxyribosyltransferase